MDLKNGNESGSKKRPVTAKKIQANRKNAQKSTGPKTLQGKMQSSTNAIKDGLFVKQLAKLPLENEDAKEFEKLYLDLVAVHQPVGRAEMLLVEKMAICQLRSARAWRFENAEIYRHHEDVRARVGNQELTPYSNMALLHREVIDRIREATAEIEARKDHHPQHLAALRGTICNGNSLLNICWPGWEGDAEKAAVRHREDIAEQIVRNRGLRLEEANNLLASNPIAQPEYIRFLSLEILGLIGNGILPQYLDSFPERLHAEYERGAIPDAVAHNKILRAEGASRRGFRESFDCLERLQHARKGEEEGGPANSN